MFGATRLDNSMKFSSSYGPDKVKIYSFVISSDLLHVRDGIRAKISYSVEFIFGNFSNT